MNVGRNKSTPNERAEDDYLACIDWLHAHADYLVVNISSPNTPGLRQLQSRAALERLLGACAERARGCQRPKPLLVKLAPDLADEALDEAADVALAVGAAGIVATNTTLQRPGGVATHPRAGEAGGLSRGAARAALASRHPARPVPGGESYPHRGGGWGDVGSDAYARIRSGATLVQAYTGYIYGGPASCRGSFGSWESSCGATGFRVWVTPSGRICGRDANLARALQQPLVAPNLTNRRIFRGMKPSPVACLPTGV